MTDERMDASTATFYWALREYLGPARAGWLNYQMLAALAGYRPAKHPSPDTWFRCARVHLSLLHEQGVIEYGQRCKAGVEVRLTGIGPRTVDELLETEVRP